ncbi:MAG: hypothetical protein MMC23_001127 [Stictis urceolatum]|nr:hypothetical protein [Stictis urceolata]
MARSDSNPPALDMSNPPSTPFTPTSHTGGTLHHYLPLLTAYEHASLTSTANPTPSTSTNTLIFIPGLYCTPLSTAYPLSLLPHLPPSWRLLEPLLSSAGTSFGTHSLTKDVEELTALVTYIRTLRPAGRVVLLGHSTGCQDAVHYLVSRGESEEVRRTAPARVDGVVLQAPVSDREGVGDMLRRGQIEGGALEEANRVAGAWVGEGRGEEVLPSRLSGTVYPGAPVSARRWLSLLSPGPGHEGEDDYFSSDFGADRLKESFGRGGRGMRWCVLHMGSDQFVPREVDKEGLMGRWRMAVLAGGGVWDQGSGVLEGGDHALEMCEDEVREEFARRAVGFLGRVKEG